MKFLWFLTNLALLISLLCAKDSGDGPTDSQQFVIDLEAAPKTSISLPMRAARESMVKRSNPRVRSKSNRKLFADKTLKILAATGGAALAALKVIEMTPLNPEFKYLKKKNLELDAEARIESSKAYSALSENNGLVHSLVDKIDNCSRELQSERRSLSSIIETLKIKVDTMADKMRKKLKSSDEEQRKGD